MRLAGCRGLLEIGPGPGVLTAALSEQCLKMIALEVDPKMAKALAESAPKAEIRLADALKTDLLETLAELPEPRGVVSNLPYYITGPLVARIAEVSANWDIAVLMMQKEVAARIVAPPGDSDRGSLSVFLQSQFSIEKVIDVPPGAFLPPPKVDSTVLEFKPLGAAMDESFYAFVRAGFKQPRKTLANNLVAMGRKREEVESRLTRAGLDERVRPHALTLEQWMEMAKD
jgi:16S rRNA (adenine1518-N6/adenine1519-N6)-dimethyltransferase